MARQRAGRGSTSDAGRQTNRADILDRLSIIEPSGLLPHEILRTDFDQVHGPRFVVRSMKHLSTYLMSSATFYHLADKSPVNSSTNFAA